MIMIDHSKRLSEPLRWGRREKTAVGVLIACLALALAGLGAYALTSGAPARADCIQIVFPSTLGGAELHSCGARARYTCAHPQAYRGSAEALRESCRRAGFAYRG